MKYSNKYTTTYIIEFNKPLPFVFLSFQALHSCADHKCGEESRRGPGQPLPPRAGAEGPEWPAAPSVTLRLRPDSPQETALKGLHAQALRPRNCAL